MIARHLSIAGGVQGVGFRDWLVKTARGLGLSGWVRNRSNGTVEALVAGEDDAVEDCIRACHHGPRLATVDHVTETSAPVSDVQGFTVRPTL